MPTWDYYFTSIQPEPIIIPTHWGNNSQPEPQQAAARDPTQQQTDTLQPGKTHKYPCMLSAKQVPVLDLTNTIITSATDLETAFHTLNLCPKDKEESSYGGEETSAEDHPH